MYKGRLTAIKLVIWISYLSIAFAQFSSLLASPTSESICLGDIEILSDRLLADLPHYANRVIRSSQGLERSDLQIRHIIIAGRPEFEPIPLSQSQYTERFTDSPTQVFFTILERRYINQQAVETQSYHWLFLTQTEQGWRLLMLLSSNSSIQPNQPPSPPRESNNSAIAQAIRLWLRDCQPL